MTAPTPAADPCWKFGPVEIGIHLEVPFVEIATRHSFRRKSIERTVAVRTRQRFAAKHRRKLVTTGDEVVSHARGWIKVRKIRRAGRTESLHQVLLGAGRLRNCAELAHTLGKGAADRQRTNIKSQFALVLTDTEAATEFSTKCGGDWCCGRIQIDAHLVSFGSYVANDTFGIFNALLNVIRSLHAGANQVCGRRLSWRADQQIERIRNAA